ncbi:MAG: flagellar basal-body rod protein FlgG [Planctomycetota bacterium]|nr:flagellar basal-body rod protein FlgG [Planctomycetota bacterium]
MLRALWASASGMQAQQLNVDTIANNLANVNTAGFKRSQTAFQDLIYDRLRTPGASSDSGAGIPVGIQMGLGTQLTSVSKIFTPGKPQQTGNQYDMWIEGNGFFQIQLSDGTLAYTRDGSFHPNAEGQLVTSEGYVLDGAPTISANATAVTISPNGTISETVNGVSTQLGQLNLYTFSNPAGLLAKGHNLFEASSSSGDATSGTPGSDGVGAIQQGFLEMSNVEVVQEMVNLIVAQRAYEVNTKAIQASDEMLQTANSIRR